VCGARRGREAQGTAEGGAGSGAAFFGYFLSLETKSEPPFMAEQNGSEPEPLPREARAAASKQRCFRMPPCQHQAASQQNPLFRHKWRVPPTGHPCPDGGSFGILPRPARTHARAYIRHGLRCSAQATGPKVKSQSNGNSNGNSNSNSNDNCNIKSAAVHA
jgi:hypothetical protein